ncbi:MAG TPA: branched-chain amino acid ABC transporter permease [Salinarimonas sp.]|nr:branched-chain amino acid ABC transporter permease [Salinarimonas sp.]
MSHARVIQLSLLGLAVLALLPLVLPPFWTANIIGRALVYGIVALSLTFLASYGGFVSLGQTMIAGVAGYTVAILAPNAIPAALPASYWVAVPVALIVASLAGLLVGAVAVRTNGIYLLMITLALAVGFSLYVQANITLFNGYEGIRNVLGPELFGLSFRNAYLFYYVTLAVAAALYLGVLYLVRSPFGLVLQGLRDNARRVSALGYNAHLHRIAAFGVAGFIAGCGGVLVTFYNIGISPGTVGLQATVNILVMSVIGGLGHPVGAFLGSLIFTVFDTFAADLYDRNRFNTLIGAVFLAIVLVSPDGVLGLIRRAAGLVSGRKTESVGAQAAPRTGA